MADIESLHLYAGVHCRECGFFRMLARRLPYAIFYRMKENSILVHAILDCRRNPKSIFQRLDQEDRQNE